MKFGLSITGARPEDSGRAATEVYRDHLATARRADELGFHTVVVTEHHFLPAHWCPAPLSLAMAVAAQTESIRVGSGILILPLYHPVRLAEDISLLDIVSGGRAVVAVGMGYRADEFAGYGIRFDERGPRYREALKLLTALLGGGPVDFDGDFHRVRGAEVRPAPIQWPHPPLWIGSTRESAIRRAARAGRTVYLGNAAPKEMLGRRIALHRDELERAGRSVEGTEVPLMREMYVAPRREDAVADMRSSLEHAYHHELLKLGYGVPVIEADGAEGITRNPAHPALALDALIADRCVLGSPEDCLEQIEHYQSLGVTEILFRVHHAHLPQEATMRSLDLFSRDVMPAFR